MSALYVSPVKCGAVNQRLSNIFQTLDDLILILLQPLFRRVPLEPLETLLGSVENHQRRLDLSEAVRNRRIGLLTECSDARYFARFVAILFPIAPKPTKAS